MRTLEEVENYFSYHAPTPQKKDVHEAINETFLHVARHLWTNIAPFNEGSPDKTYMLRALSDARMAANMAVACGPDELYL